MGQIIARGPRKWLVKEFIRSEVVDGKRKLKYASKTVTGNLAAAKDALSELTNEIRSGSFVPPATQTLQAFVSWWLGEVVAQRAEAATVKSYTDRIAPLLQSVGSIRLDRVSTAVLQRSLNTLASERGWSRRTAGYTKTILSMALAEAVRQGILRVNPASSMIVPRGVAQDEHVEPESVVWTAEQVQLFLERTKDSEWYPCWHFLLNSGVRPGEACGLQWTDLKGGDATIQRSIKSDGKGHWYAGATKTKRARQIALPLHTVRLLRQLRDGKLTGYVFWQDGTDHMNPIQMHGGWMRDCKRAGLPDLGGPYGARHTHATLLLSLNVPIKVVSERLGHASVQITMDTYQHVLPHMQEDVADKLTVALGG